jgi:hypothetical protein
MLGSSGSMTSTEARKHSRWGAVFAILFRTTPHGLLRRVRGFGGTPIEELVVTGRRSGLERSLLVSAVDIGGNWYIGHPNGPSDWTLNLEAAGQATLRTLRHGPIRVTAVALERGAERDRAIETITARQVLPVRAIYGGARRYITAVGSYYRLEPQPDPSTSPR